MGLFWIFVVWSVLCLGKTYLTQFRGLDTFGTARNASFIQDRLFLNICKTYNKLSRAKLKYKHWKDEGKDGSMGACSLTFTAKI